MAKAKKVQRTIYFDPEVWEHIERTMKVSKNANVSAVVNDGLKYAAFPEHRSDREADMVKMMQVLSDSFVQHRKKTARDLAFIQEISLESLKEFYRHHDPLPQDIIKERDVSAKDSMRSFIESIVRNMPKLKSFSDREQGE